MGNKRVLVTPEEQAKLRELYNQGLQDIEIAKILYVSPFSVRQWRIVNGLPSNKNTRRDKERMVLYQQGFSDREICRRLNLNPCGSTITQWRQSKGLPPNKVR